MNNSKPTFAPPPWDFEASGKPGSNGDLNIYVVDKNKRKIAAVWGKREEKELTACLMISAPDMLTVLKKAEKALAITGYESHGHDEAKKAVSAVIAQAEGRA